MAEPLNDPSRAHPPCLVRRALLGAVAALFLAGCTSLPEYVANGFKVGPSYGRPPAPVAQDWIDAGDVRIRRDETEPIAWWTALRDPVLDSLVCGVYQQNLTLREAGFRVLEARAKYGIAVGNFFPQQQAASGSYDRVAISKNNANVPPGVDRFFNQWATGFGLAWELDFWGRYRRAIEAADADLDASVENYDDVLVTLIGDVAATYVQLRILEQQLRFVQANVEIQRATLNIAQAKFKGGLTSELDLDQAVSVLAQTEALIPQLEIRIRQATDHLCFLLGIPMENLRARMPSGPIPTAAPDVVVGIPADLIRRRPDVRRAERDAAAQSARIGVAEADFYPSFFISGNFGWQAERFANLFTPGSFAGNVGPSFQWNLLNYGRIYHNMQAQDARFQQAVAGYQNTVLKAGAEVEDGLVVFLKSQQEARSLAQSVTAAQKAVKTSVAQYRGGLVDFNRVAVLEQNLVGQQNQLARAQGDIALGMIQVYRALGGGWQIRLTGCNPEMPPVVAAPEPVAAPLTGTQPTPMAAPAFEGKP